MAEVPIATAVGWVVSPVIRLVIDKTTTYLGNKFFKKAGIEEDMKKMKTTLTEILSVMAVVEKQKIEDLNQAQLVREIKDAVYDAEDIMDEFEYYLLQEESEKQRKTVSHLASSSSRAVYQYVFGYRKFKYQVREVRESLDRAKVSAQMLLELIKVNNSGNVHALEYENWCVTSSLVSDLIIGRDRERESLMDLLLRQSDGSASQTLPKIIPIVGLGGIGKTTLAQMVFNDPRLNGRFDHKIWITVSNKFDMMRLTREMLEQVCENNSTGNISFDMTQRKVEMGLEFKKVLLILDDVWYNKGDTEEYSYKTEWLNFLAPLKKTEQGSKIILTTRDPTVNLILATERSIVLDGLSEDDSWSLFKMCAFDCENQHKHQELEPIGKEIVNKFKGLALAVRVVGAQLRGNSDVEEWRRTLNDNLIHTSDIMKILQRSYQHIPEHLKRCFAYCSLFPKGYHLNPDELVHMWIAQGFVCSGETKHLEVVGKSYFKKLLAKSFFQVIKQGYRDCYVMHDLMHDLASHISKNECLILSEGKSMKELGSIRHLSVTPETLGVLTDTINGFDKLRTLMILNWIKLDDQTIIKKLLMRLKRIRVLHIEWTLECLPNIAGCKHLRYISFNVLGNNLPDCFNNFHRLSAIFVRGAGSDQFNTINFPESIYNSSSMTIIGIDSCLDMRRGKPVKLGNLWGGPCIFRVGEGHRLDLLGDMNKTKGDLTIEGLEEVTCKEEAINAQLSRKENVINLRLYWENPSIEMESSRYDEVLEALKPNSNLESLLMIGYAGSALPSWMEANLLSAVQAIKLLECVRITKLPPLGQLPLLKYLHMEGLLVRIIGLEFYGNGKFPSLKSLVIDQFLLLEKICYPCDKLVFPNLDQLAIENCPMFRGSELDGFSGPKHLRCSSYYGSINMDLRRHVSMIGLTSLEIDHCRGLITIERLHEMVSLRKLLINDCPDLVSLPEMEFFYSLEFLGIFECPELMSLPKNGLPVSLQMLCIGDVHHTLKEQIHSKKGHNWDKIVAISGCHLYSTVDNWGYNLWVRHKYSTSSIEDLVSSDPKMQEYKVNKDVHVQHSI